MSDATAPFGDGGESPQRPVHMLEGQHIGPYRVEREIGEGGMGAVFLATRATAEFTQQVALKLLRVGLFSATQQEQFRREQQIHARLVHPHIARVFDSGVSEAGVPYFAMEYIDGVAITSHCDAQRLGVEARLKLFIDVCDAVAYAHQNLVVHRDLKPSNILVGGDGQPKLLDFGIAKLLASESASGSTRTEMRQLTPGYAAPEQFDGSGVTTATDVYALGVLLVEMLTGYRPPPAQTDQALLRLTARAQDAQVAQVRGVSLRALRRRLRGDLDAITQKALQSDPRRRYRGAAELRDDIQRHLAGKPIRARPDAAAYRFVKFVQRHKVGVAASLGLAATLIAATWFSLRQANFARAEAARANAEAGRATAVKTFLQELFNSAAPGVSTVESADELLARGRERVDHDFGGNPDLRAEILGLLGDLQRRRGHVDLAQETLEQAATQAAALFGGGDARTLNAEYLLALQADDASHYREGAQRLQKALDAFQAAGNQPAETLVLAQSELGLLYQRIGDNERAIALAQGAVELARRMPGGGPVVTTALANLGDIYKESGKFNEALPLLEEALAMKRRQFGAAHVAVAEAMAQLASAQHKLGHYADAERLLRDAVAIDRTGFSRPAMQTAAHLNNLAVEVGVQGNLADSAKYLHEAIGILQQLFPNGHVDIADDMTNIASIDMRQGSYAEAETAMRQAIAEEVRVRGAGYPDFDGDQNMLARILVYEGKLDEARAPLGIALGEGRKHAERTTIASTLTTQALLFQARSEYADAVASAREAVAVMEKLLPPQHNKITTMRLVLGENLAANGQHADAQKVFAAALDYARQSKSPITVLIARSLADLARVSDVLGDSEASRKLDREARSELDKIPPGPNAEREQVVAILNKVPANQAYH